MVDLKHLRYFLTVAEEGTFTRAAERLGMTQPALSRAIRALEDAVGIALFVRGPHGVELTAAGRMLNDDARGVDEFARAALARVARFSRDGPRLRVTARGCDVDTLQQLVTSYNERFPREPSAHAETVHWQLQADQLRGGTADVTLLRSPFDGRGLDSDLLWTEARVALLPETHPLAGRDVLDRAELAGETFPCWADMAPADLAFWAGSDLTSYDWRPGPVVHDGAQFIGSIRLGHAIGFVAGTLLPDTPLPGIRVVPVTGLSACELRVAWAAGATSPDVARFVRHATRQATAYPTGVLQRVDDSAAR